jgi:hypothetical protein
VSPIELLRKLEARPWSERRLLARAALSLAIMRVAVDALPFRLIAAATGLGEGRSAQTVDPATEWQAAGVGRAVRVAAAHAPWETTCLAQALAASSLLRRRGISSTLYLAVASDDAAPERMIAHAWLRCGSLVLTGATQPGRFTVIASFATDENASLRDGLVNRWRSVGLLLAPNVVRLRANRPRKRDAR